MRLTSSSPSFAPISTAAWLSDAWGEGGLDSKRDIVGEVGIFVQYFEKSAGLGSGLCEASIYAESGFGAASEFSTSMFVCRP